MNEVQLYIKNNKFVTKGTVNYSGADYNSLGLNSYMTDINQPSTNGFQTMLQSRIESGESITVFNLTDSTSTTIEGFVNQQVLLLPYGINIFAASDDYSVGAINEWDKSELFEDETIKLKQAIKNYRDVAKILTDSVSYTHLTLPTILRV